MAVPANVTANTAVVTGQTEAPQWDGLAGGRCSRWWRTWVRHESVVVDCLGSPNTRRERDHHEATIAGQDAQDHHEATIAGQNAQEARDLVPGGEPARHRSRGARSRGTRDPA